MKREVHGIKPFLPRYQVYTNNTTRFSKSEIKNKFYIH